MSNDVDFTKSQFKVDDRRGIKVKREKVKKENKEKEIKELKFILIVNILITTWRICGFVAFYTYLY